MSILSSQMGPWGLPIVTLGPVKLIKRKLHVRRRQNYAQVPGNKFDSLELLRRCGSLML